MKIHFLFSLLGLTALPLFSQDYKVSSPDRSLTAEISIGKEVSAVLKSGTTVITGLENISLITGINEKPQMLKVQRVNKRSVSETVRPEIREKAAELTNEYNELEIKFTNNKAVTFRVFNEGFAYRFSTSVRDSITIIRENLDITFEKGDSAWFQSSGSFNSAYETPYEHKLLDSIGSGTLCNLPFLVKKCPGSFIMITESDLYNYPGLWLKGTGKQQLSAVNPPFPASYNYSGNLYNHGQVKEAHDYIARVAGTRTYPWRIFAVANDEESLVANNMVYLLATPCSQADVSWIRPGVVMFDWWGKHNIYGVDFKAGINTETAKYFIDFCAAHGFRYFLFDDGWCVNQDILKPLPGLNMPEVTSYAASKGVDVMVWVIWNSLEKKWDDAFDLFRKWGIKGIKIDFMNRDDQRMVEFYEKAARKAADEKMVLDFHGAYKPCGLSRKYPNVLTREALIEFEYNGWTSYDNPVHHNLLPYIRMFAGPMDYIPATLRNSTKNNFRPESDYPMGQGTRAHAMALFVILSSPMTMLPDSPSDYYREKECTDFLSAIPVVWDESRLLDGKIAKYTVIARRSGTEWYVGAITDWERRVIKLETGFLAPGKYRLEAIEDGINADTRAEDYRRREIIFNSGEVLNLKLASGGGWIAHISRLTENN